MTPRAWLWTGVVLDLLLLLPASYMAFSAGDLATSSGAGLAFAVAALFVALPIFCIMAPLTAWRAAARGRSVTHVIVRCAIPWIYAGFLVAFLFYG